MNKKEANKIQVNRSTQVGSINGVGIDAEDLEKWAYRRLKTWPELLTACEVAVLALTHTPVNPKDIKTIKKAIKEVIAKAKNH